MAVAVTQFSDPGCPWAYSASPALATLRWRYGDQLRWRLVTIGLTEDAEQYVKRGYTPLRQVNGYRGFRRYGMPFNLQLRERIAATARACRAIVATRLQIPAREEDVFRALQLGQFAHAIVLDRDEDLRRTLAGVPDIDADAIVAAIDDPAVVAAYEADRAEARSAAGTPTEAQGRAANTDGVVRYTAPSLVFTREADGTRLEAGGFQTLEAYDVVLANLDPTLERRPEAEHAREALNAFPAGLVTQEVAAIMAPRNQPPERDKAEQQLLELAAAGSARRLELGDDALWIAA